MAGKQGPETRLVKKMRDAGQELYGRAHVMVKNHGSEFSEAGVSDLTGLVLGVGVAVEVKAPESYGGSVEKALRDGPTVKQRIFVSKVLAAGGCAGFAATVDQYMAILDHAAQRSDGILMGIPCSGHNTEVE